MQFNIPTNKTEMYNVLNDLFYYYRTKRGEFQNLELKPLELTRMEYVPLTDQEIEDMAEVMVASKQAREISEQKKQLWEKSAQLSKQIEAIESDYEESKSEIENLYSESIKKVEMQAVKNGLVSSGIIVNKVSELESEKNSKISLLTQSKQQKRTSLLSEQQTVSNRLSTLEQDFQTIHSHEVAEKVIELKQQREELTRKVFEYNNALDEKEQRYDNTILQHNASLELRYLEISSGEYSKDQLIEMGYYKDVLACVYGYYNSMAALDAYRDISSESKIHLYLEEYYSQAVELYRIKAGL